MEYSPLEAVVVDGSAKRTDQKVKKGDEPKRGSAIPESHYCDAR